MLRSLAPGDVARLLPAAVTTRALRAALELGGSARTLAVLERIPSRPRRTRPGLDLVRRRARVLALAGGHGPYPARCLPQSLALWTWLRWQGIPSRVVVGVPLDGELRAGAFTAHAWVEVDGVCVSDPGEVVDGYAPFARPLIEG